MCQFLVEVFWLMLLMIIEIFNLVFFVNVIVPFSFVISASLACILLPYLFLKYPDAFVLWLSD